MQKVSIGHLAGRGERQAHPLFTVRKALKSRKAPSYMGTGMGTGMDFHWTGAGANSVASPLIVECDCHAWVPLCRSKGFGGLGGCGVGMQRATPDNNTNNKDNIYNNNNNLPYELIGLAQHAPAPGLRLKIPVFSDPDPGKS